MSSLQEAYAERVYGQMEPPRFRVGRLALKYEMDRYDASGNFSRSGQSEALLGSFEAYNAYLGFENDISATWSVGGGLLMGLSRSRVGRDSRRNTDIKGAQFVINRVLSDFGSKKASRFKIIADFKAFLSLHDYSLSSDEVSIGDGVSWTQAGAWFGTDAYKYLRIWFYGGFYYPFGDLSKNLVFMARPEFKVKGGRLGFGIEGQTPVMDDKDLGNPTTRLRIIDELNGGSFYYHPLNAEFVTASAWFGFEPAPLTEIKIGIGETLIGQFAHQGLRIFVSVEASFSVTGGGYRFPFFKIQRGDSEIQKNQGRRRLKNYAKPRSREE